MKDCLFCKIIAGEIPNTKVYEDENTYAFMDITPVIPGHVLMVPKEHSRNIFDASDEVLSKIAPVLKKISRAVKDATGSDGINVHENNEPASGQVVFHLHFHIIPRFENDGLKMWHGREYSSPAEMSELAEKIKKEL